jgi:hypothetical protein
MAYAFAMVAFVIGLVALVLPGRNSGGRKLTGFLMVSCGSVMVMAAGRQRPAALSVAQPTRIAVDLESAILNTFAASSSALSSSDAVTEPRNSVGLLCIR